MSKARRIKKQATKARDAEILERMFTTMINNEMQQIAAETFGLVDPDDSSEPESSDPKFSIKINWKRTPTRHGQ